MKKNNPLNHILLVVLCGFVVLTSCKQNDEKESKKMTDNILLEEWTGPYDGVPAFDKMNVDDIKEAMQMGMELSLTDIDKIANNT